MLYAEFYRKLAERREGSLASATPHLVNDFELPKASIIHYVPVSSQDFGISAQHPMLLKSDRNFYVDHIETIEVLTGTVQKTNVQASAAITQYHKRFLKAKRLRKIETVQKDLNNPIVINHGPLSVLFRYRKSAFSVYEESYNLLHNAIKHISEYKGDASWNHWLPLELAEHLPDVASLREATISTLKTDGLSIRRELISEFHEVSDLVILELWKFATNNKSLFDILPLPLMRKVNLVWFETGSWLWVNLGDLNDWRTGADGEVLAKRLIEMLMRLFEARTTFDVGLDDTPDKASYINSEETLTKTVLDKANEMMAAGKLSTAQFRRMEKLATNYTRIESPTGKGTLADHITIAKDELKVDAGVIPDIAGVVDKTMLRSSLSSFDSDYIKTVMSKDIANHVMAFQRAGIAVLDYQVERTVDAANKYDTYTVKLQPVDGSTSTIKFSIPTVGDNGVYIANGVKYRMAKQPGD